MIYRFSNIDEHETTSMLTGKHNVFNLNPIYVAANFLLTRVFQGATQLGDLSFQTDRQNR